MDNRRGVDDPEIGERARGGEETGELVDVKLRTGLMAVRRRRKVGEPGFDNLEERMMLKLIIVLVEEVIDGV